MHLIPAESSFFDLIGGLPMHPLVVHFAVVLLPLSALALLAAVLVPRWRPRVVAPALVGSVAGSVAAFVAKESGEALAKRVDLPRQHAAYGDALPWLALLFTALAAAWWWRLRSRTRAHAASPGVARSDTVTRLMGLGTALLAPAVVVLTTLAGHSGATAAWADQVIPAGETVATPASDTAKAVVPSAGGGAAPTASRPGTGDVATSTPAGVQTRPAGTASVTSPATTAASAAPVSPTAAGSATTLKTFTAAEVAKHATASDCWTIVNGDVYDVTSWISRHPGGPKAIKRMCGQDASAAFNDQHEGQRRPASRLKTFQIGRLVA